MAERYTVTINLTFAILQEKTVKLKSSIESILN